MATAYSDPGAIQSSLSSLGSLDPEHLLLNDLLQDKPVSPSCTCHTCETSLIVRSHCRVCNIYLCDKCVLAHIRISANRGHVIDYDFSFGHNDSFPTTTASTSTSNSSPSVYSFNGAFCETHVSEPINLFCDACSVPICSECELRDHRGHYIICLQDIIENARTCGLKALAESKSAAQSYKDSVELLQRQLDAFNKKTVTVARDIWAAVRKHLTALEERERELLSKLEKIKALKQKQFQQQMDSLTASLSVCAKTTEALSAALEVGNPVDILFAKEYAKVEMQNINSRVLFNPTEEDLSFTPPDPSLITSLASMGDVIVRSNYTSPGHPVFDNILRNVSRPTPVFQPSLNKTSLAVDLPCLTDTLSPFLSSPVDNLKSDLDESSGLVSSGWGNSKFFRGLDPISDRPNIPPGPIGAPVVSKRPNRYYPEISKPRFVFGGEGESDGQLCRPWGVCCDAEGNIIVADRSNNRIQVFTSEGVFIRKFGTQGSKPGEFDRPAGVATDPQGRIIVTDKDNHRIQIFTAEGKFLFTFGEKGIKAGQFNYPWDIAVNSKGRIVVSDTRNHRIQLFSPDGVFLNKYGFENLPNMWKHFDSPRGLCFGSEGCVIVTDFNNHRLVVIEADFKCARSLGSEGNGINQFLRPQGVAVDAKGNIIVADSRNNRIQIFEPNGSFLCQFGKTGTEPGQLDRPSGVCLSPNGDIIVVDFGNHRVQIF